MLGAEPKTIRTVDMDLSARPVFPNHFSLAALYKR